MPLFLNESALVVARVLQFAFEIEVDKAFLVDDSQLLMKALFDDGGSLIPYELLVEDIMLCSPFLFNYIILTLEEKVII